MERGPERSSARAGAGGPSCRSANPRCYGCGRDDGARRGGRPVHAVGRRSVWLARFAGTVPLHPQPWPRLAASRTSQIVCVPGSGADLFPERVVSGRSRKDLRRANGRAYYLGRLREYPSRDYLGSGARPASVGVKGEETIGAILAMAAEGEEGMSATKQGSVRFRRLLLIGWRNSGSFTTFGLRRLDRVRTAGKPRRRIPPST
jgi:hypothetical protein